MTSLAAIENLPSGARFYRADLHIHSFGGSHDVKDVTMTPEAIVRTAIDEKLHIIAVADHNEIRSVEATLKAAAGSPVLVIPAVELSTSDGHLLCFLPTFDVLQKFVGRISIVDRDNSNSRCQNSILDCLNQLDQLHGFGVLAHVDAPSGFETENAGNSPHKTDVLCHKTLLGIEVKDSSSPITYSDIDPDVNRATCGKERIRRLGLGSRQYLARMLNSDSHTLNALGRNARGDRKVTRVKMDRPSFDALRIALEDGDARVRIEDHIPIAVPHVIGMHIEGGFLDGEQIHFNPNLNCIIGGRGTGKSTMFEAVRCLSGESSGSPLVDSEIWPNQLGLFWRDQAGQVHSLSRPIDSTLSNLDDPVNGPIAFPIESYGQGETAQISKQAHDNPIALLSYLDRFVDIGSPSIEENEARDDLLKLQTEIEKATNNVEMIPQSERALATTQQQLVALEQAKAKEVIALQRKLAAEREIRSHIVTKLAQIEQGLDALLPKAIVDEITALGDPTTFAVGADEFAKIVASARSFETEVVTTRTQAKASFQKLHKTAEIQLTAWKAKETEALKTIETKRKVLEAQNIRLDMAYIQKLAKDEAKLKSDLGTLRAWKPRLQELQRKRSEASKKRWAARERIATARDAYGRAATDTLKSALTDLTVSLKFLRSAYSPDAEQQIIEAMGWRTIQVPRAGLLIQRITVPGLLNSIDKSDATSIISVTTDEGAKVFDKAEAERIVERLTEAAIRFALERCEVYDLPRLTVTKAIAGPNGKLRYVNRDFSRLSLGQQQSVLLALMLSSESNAPLIIDQPEDNLDGEFIYHSLVPVLRLAKERRQVIIVTHNANIAVLGDAEQIAVLKSTSEKGVIVSRGSIDDPTTREAACSILEGAKEAFQRRAKIYGVC
jgi:ABC-type cobalamin/Fe3+-siderophores transport system ATPase subunit